MSHYDETRNRFNPENRFIGDIEDGKRYPFACYTKEESDARYAPISTGTSVEELAATVQALSATVASLSSAINGKASQSDLAALSEVVASKASQSALQSLAATVSTKADESECVAIRARLDALESGAILISEFNASDTQFVLGQTATVTLNWTTNKTPTAQAINDVAVTGSSKVYSGVTADTTYSLYVTDGMTSDTDTVSVKFLNKIYYGVASDLSSVNALTSVVSDYIERTFTVTAGAGQYIIYAFPSRLGSAEFYVGSFEGGFDSPVEQTITNSEGYSETYKVYKSTNANLGTTTVEVKEA